LVSGWREEPETQENGFRVREPHIARGCPDTGSGARLCKLHFGIFGLSGAAAVLAQLDRICLHPPTFTASEPR